MELSTLKLLNDCEHATHTALTTSRSTGTQKGLRKDCRRYADRIYHSVPAFYYGDDPIGSAVQTKGVTWRSTSEWKVSGELGEKIRDEGMVRNKAIHVALGVLADGTKVVLGLWIEQNEGTKFWLRVMNELPRPFRRPALKRRHVGLGRLSIQ